MRGGLVRLRSAPSCFRPILPGISWRSGFDSNTSFDSEKTMANPRHLEILKQGVDAWNRWREENRSDRVDLSFAKSISVE